MSDEEDAQRLMTALVSRRTGILTEITPQPRGPDEPCPPHLWNATLAHYGFGPASLMMRTAGGKGLTQAQGQLAAMGEALERYAAVAWDQTRMRVRVASETAITPADCVLYSAAQYATGMVFQAWAPHTETTWINGTELPSDTPVDLPAALVYLVTPPPRREDHVTHITSNGLATGKDLTHAILSGLQEVIERDAFMITWLNRLPATHVRTPETGCHAAPIIRHYARFGVTLRLMSLHTDQAPYVMMAIAEDPAPDGAARIVGLGCDLDPARAIDKAVFELCQLRPGMVARVQTEDASARLNSYEDVMSIEDHGMFHTLSAQADEFDFLSASQSVCNLGDLPNLSRGSPEEDLKLMTSTAEKTGVRVAYAEITPPDIAPLGPRVVRVIGSGLQPIHFGFGKGRYGGARLFEAPVNWGLRATPLTEAELNPCPHPLA